jgi:GAF domain-containing protein
MNEEKLQILLVDDEASLRVPLKQYLEGNYSYRIDLAENGDRALELVLENHGGYDVAVIDQLLHPGPNGIETMQNIRSRFPEVECIIFTGWGSDMRQEALQAGAFRYLEKSMLDYDELAMLIRTAAQQVRLRAISRSILSKQNTEEVLVEINQAACSLSQADDAVIVLLNPLTNRLETYATGDALHMAEVRHFSEHDLVREIIQTGQIVTVPDCTEDPRVDPGFKSLGYHSFVGIPVPGTEENLGVLLVYSRRAGHFNAWGSIALLQTLAGQTSLAISNARAFDEIRSHAEFMEALVHAAEGLSRATHEQEQIELAGEFVLKRLQVSTVFVALYDGDTKVLTFPLFYDQGKRVAIPPKHLDRKDERSGLSGYVARTGNELSWETAESRHQDCAVLGIEPVRHGKPCETCFYLPLKVGRRTIGVMSIQSYERYAFSAILLNAFRALASQLAISLESNRRFGLLQHALGDLSTLNQVVLEIGSERRRNELLQMLIRQAVQLLGAEGGALYLLDNRREFFRLETGMGLPPNSLGRSFPVNEGINGQILKHGKAQKVNQYSEWEHRQRFYDSTPLTCVAGAPIHIHNQIIGTLTVHDTRPERSFDDSLLELLQQFANHAALALQKTDLLEKLEKIQEVAASINATQNPADIYAQACRAAVELFRADHSAVVLFDPELQTGRVEGEHPETLQTRGLTIPLSRIPFEQELISTQHEIVLAEIHTAPRRLGALLKIWQRLDIHSIAIIPLVHQGRILGSFSLEAIGHPQVFNEDDIELSKVLAAHVAVAVVNARLFEQRQHHEQLLAALDEASRTIRAEKDTPKILHETVRLAVQLIGGSAGCLFINEPHLGELELRTLYELPDELKGIRIRQGTGLVGKAAQSGSVQIGSSNNVSAERDPIFAQYQFKTIVTVPIHYAAEVDAVIMVAFQNDERAPTATDVEILERFSIQVGMALHTSRLLTREQRAIGQLDILRQISSYMQRARDLNAILHVVLTGLTAGYGLRFNRAALFLLDDRREKLVGQIGIGHLVKETAEYAWAEHVANGREDFSRYISLLEQKQLESTPVGERIQGLQLSLAGKEAGMLLSVLEGPGCHLVSQAELDSLPAEFLHAFEPAIPLVIAPLIARDRAIGCVVADNKFTQSPITGDDLDVLMTFAGNAAIAIENAQLFDEAKLGQDRLHAFFNASNALAWSQEPNAVLQEIVERAQAEAGASGVTTLIMDEEGNPARVITAGRDNPDAVKGILRANGISARVFEGGKPEIIESTTGHTQINPIVFELGIAAALCLPLTLQNRQIGVMWIHYAEERHFDGPEIEAIQLYANHAALAYDSSRLLEQVTRARNATKTVLNVAVLENLQNTITSILHGTQDVLECDAVTLYEYDPEREILRYPPAMLGVKYPERVVRFSGVLSQSIVYDVLNRQEPLVVEDTNQDDRFRTLRFTVDEGVRSFVGIPLRAGPDKVGVMFVNYHALYRFTSDSLLDIQHFANLAAVAIRNAQLYEKEKHHQHVLQSIQNTSAAVSAVLNLDTLLPTITRRAASIFEAQAASLMLWDDKHEFLVIRAAYGLQQEYIQGQRISNQRVDSLLSQEGTKPYILDLIHDPLGVSSLVQQEGLRQVLAAPLVVGNELLGALNIYSKSTEKVFIEQDKDLAATLANHMAIAIQNARNFEAAKQHARELSGLNSVSQSIRHLTEISLLYRHVNSSVANLAEAEMCAILLYDANENQLVCQRSAYGVPDEIVQNYRIPLGRAELEQIWETQEYLLINNVETDPLVAMVGLCDLAEQAGLKNTLFVKLVMGQKKIGLLQVSNKRDGSGFSENDASLLCIIAGQAAAVIENAGLYEELRKTNQDLNATKDQLASRTTLAWFGMISSTWRHAIQKHALTIKDQVGLLRMQFLGEADKPGSAQDRLDMIERLANQIIQKPITPPLSSEEGVVSLAISELVRERISQLRDNGQYARVRLDTDFAPDGSHTVRANPDWLRRALDLIVENAVNATKDKADGRVTIRTRYTEKRMEIVVADNGKGFPPEALKLAGIGHIPKKKGEAGLGLGLLMAQVIVQTYGGEIPRPTSGPHGTEVVISLPVE